MKVRGHRAARPRLPLVTWAGFKDTTIFLTRKKNDSFNVEIMPYIEKYIICPLFYLISPLSKKKGAYCKSPVKGGE